MKILITGGAGFIGSNFIHYWLKNHPKDEIINLDKLTYAGNLENLAPVKNNPNYKFVKGDICDAKIVNKTIKGVDVVVHFAAESHVDRSILGPAIFIQTNVVGTQVLLDAASEAKIKRFHHISTDEVWGALKLNSPEKFTEETIYNPRSPYAASKAAADHLVRAYYHTYSLPITISNCSNNFGPYQFPEKIISLAITNVLEGKKIPIYGDGLYVRDWIYVEDHCRGIELILEKGKVGETYLIGADNELANIDLAKKILKILGKANSFIEYVKDRPGHDRKYAIDATKIKKELGFQPMFDFEDALRSTIKWYKNNQTWWRKIRTGEYLNYYEKQYGRA
ncbi:dTDP-glucose 4,6-dehydratase [Candidatus Curtissbacteria bacterium RBG_16_39_7]|uniref:dTDP-glucose 4,6-dehydratase n=1 Tax=Candidatus Curtissbacteria bacterium RBG_16_39_7 TaxID=1797707 RepID=A0A1F5G2W6_9BACT|nr:MAG: dTDP-glucose 4,6-dehydratase [Candidatus Curtissbacteria bacterium RBG_16_39_7]